MRHFLIVFQYIPDCVLLYSLDTDDVTIIKQVESMHRRYVGGLGTTPEISEFIISVDQLPGVCKLLDDSDTMASMLPINVSLQGDYLTVILTGAML